VRALTRDLLARLRKFRACGTGTLNAPRRAAGLGADTASEAVVVRTNIERKKLGLPELARSNRLMRAAQLQANQMAAALRMAHELPEARYSTMDDRLTAVGYHYRAAGENVAEGQPDAAFVVAGWMKSPGHRANIVSANYAEMGAAVAMGKNGRRFWVQVFGTPR
jgi:Uncharacterized protein with SCP/PR1 domains